jgi:flagellar biosynthetic protein FliS
MNHAALAYARTQRETASKERTLVLLLETALRHLRLAATAFEERRDGDAVASLTRATDIVMELHGTLDTSRAPELCETLGELYRFISGKLLLAATTHTTEPIREAERVLVPIVEGFAGAVASLGGGSAK